MVLVSTIQPHAQAKTVLSEERRALLLISTFSTDAEYAMACAARCLGVPTRGCVANVHGAKKWRCKVAKANLEAWGIYRRDRADPVESCDVINALDADVVVHIVAHDKHDNAHRQRYLNVCEAVGSSPLHIPSSARTLRVEMDQDAQRASVYTSIADDDMRHFEDADAQGLDLAYTLANLRRTDEAPLRVMFMAQSAPEVAHACRLLLTQTLKFMGYSATDKPIRPLKLPKHPIFGCCAFVRGADMGFADAALEHGVPCFGQALTRDHARRQPFETHMKDAIIVQRMTLYADANEDQGVCDMRNLHTADIVIPIALNFEERQRLLSANERAFMVLESVYKRPDHDGPHRNHDEGRSNAGHGYVSCACAMPDLEDCDLERFAASEQEASKIAAFIRTSPRVCPAAVPTVMFIGPEEHAVPGITEACHAFSKRVFELLGYEPKVECI